MNINKEKLIDLLVEKTGMGKKDVEKQLEQLIARIMDAADRGKALEIKEFGMFYFDESDELKFDPAEELSSEISFKYAGMQPVEINPERDTAFTGGKSVEEQQDEKESKPEPAFITDEPVKSDEPGPSQKSEKPKEPKQPEEKKEKPKKEKKKESVKKSKKDSSSTINKVIFTIAAVLLLTILAFGYMYYTDSVDTLSEAGDQPQPEEQQLDPLPEETPEMAESPEMIPELEPESPDEVTNGEEELMEPIIEPQSTYGLMGEIVEEANDGFSIVVHSFNNEENARSSAAALNNDGYRVLVSARTVNADSVWRVSVGQFQTLQGATEAARDLPSPYNTQNFVQRIQIN